MTRALVNENKVFCPNCEELLSETCTDYFLVKDSNTAYYEFTRKCDKCNRNYTYYVDTSFKNRYSLNENEVNRIEE